MEKGKEALKERKRYDEAFKRSVVDHWRGSGKSVAAVAVEFGINHWVLRDWTRKYAAELKGPEAALPESVDAMRLEIQQLRRELARVSNQREILKKTLGIIVEA